MSDGIDERPANHLRAYWKAVRRRWPLIVVLGLLAGGAAYLYSQTAPKEYQATSKVLLEQEEPIESLIGEFGGQPADPEREVNTDVALIKLETIADRVRTRLKLDTRLKPLIDSVETKPDGNSNIVTITASNEDPALAAAIANGFAEEYARFRREAARGNINEAAELARGRLEGLSPEERAGAAGRELEARTRELEIASALQTGGVEVVRRAEPPIEPSAPRPLFNTALGGLLGGLLAIGLAIMLELVDRRLRDEDDVNDVFGLPVLATIPAFPRRTRAGRPGEDPLQRESYGTLAANLRFANVDRRLRALIITSPSSGDGKTNVTLGLAGALTTLGQRVIAVEADLRKPTFARYLSLPTTSGLSSVIAGVSTLDDSLVEMHADELRPIAGADPVDALSFSVLPAGPLPPNPQQLLASPAMEQVLADASKRADVVIIDTPPIGTVTDAATLIEDVDATILVTRLKWTRRDAARRALRTLRNLEVRTLGLAVTNTPRSVETYYGEREYVQGPAERAQQARR